MKVNINEQQEAPSSFEALPTDIYTMRIKSAAYEDDIFADPNTDGTKPQKLCIVWEIKDLTEEQEEYGVRDDALVWQRINPWYGITKAGVPSKFKEFVDGLIAAGVLQTDDEGNFDTDDLVGIVQKCTVEKYTLSMGKNKGNPGNKVIAVAPLRKPKTKAQQVQPVAAAAPVRTKPEPVATIDDRDLPF